MDVTRHNCSGGRGLASLQPAGDQRSGGTGEEARESVGGAADGLVCVGMGRLLSANGAERR